VWRALRATYAFHCSQVCGSVTNGTSKTQGVAIAIPDRKVSLPIRPVCWLRNHDYVRGDTFVEEQINLISEETNVGRSRWLTNVLTVLIDKKNQYFVFHEPDYVARIKVQSEANDIDVEVSCFVNISNS
jgi:hypothetical protein